jgi:hypothetical protein
MRLQCPVELGGKREEESRGSHQLFLELDQRLAWPSIDTGRSFCATSNGLPGNCTSHSIDASQA